MTLDKTIAPHDLSATLRRWVVGYTGPASYATGGDTVTPADDVGMGKVFAILGLSISNGTAVLHGWYNTSTSKIMWFVAAGTQVTNTTDLSTYTGRFEFLGQ